MSTIEEVARNAEIILFTTDWSELPSITNPVNDPHLANASEFVAYRVLVRKIRLNPTVDAVFPNKPTEIWYNP